MVFGLPYVWTPRLPEKMCAPALYELSVFMGFFAIMNPIANTPIFLSLTADDDPAIRKQVTMKAVIAAFGVILVFCLLGKVIFSMFGITLPAFRITGGLLVALIGYNMLHGEQSKVHHSGSAAQNLGTEAELSIAVTPLAIPILAGSGTIATALRGFKPDCYERLPMTRLPPLELLLPG